MTDPVFKAEYVNFKTVPSRKVVQITLEAPMEMGDQIIALLGMPNPERSKWLGCALLNTEHNEPAEGAASSAAGSQQGDPSPYPASSAPSGHTKTNKDPAGRSWTEIPYVHRAGIHATNKVFWEFCGALNEEQAAAYIREFCGVKSRRDIVKNTAASDAFETLDKNFDTWVKYERRAS